MDQSDLNFHHQTVNVRLGASHPILQIKEMVIIANNSLLWCPHLCVHHQESIILFLLIEGSLVKETITFGLKLEGLVVKRCRSAFIRGL